MAIVKELAPPDKHRRQYYDRYRMGVWLVPQPDPKIYFNNEEPDVEQYEFVVFEQWEVPRTDEDKYYEVRAGLQRLDHISLEFYGTPRLWWLIALANDIMYPWKELEVGTLLRIPDLGTLHAQGYFEGILDVGPSTYRNYATEGR